MGTISGYVINRDFVHQTESVDMSNTGGDVQSASKPNDGAEAENLRPKPMREEPGALTARLKDMIANASEQHVTSLDAKTVRANTASIMESLKAEIAQLKGANDPALQGKIAWLEDLSKAMGKDLEKLASTARKTFAALGKLQGLYVGLAFNAGELSYVRKTQKQDGTIVPAHYEYEIAEIPGQEKRTKKLREIGTIVANALNAQEALADHLEYLHRKTGGTCDGLYAMSTASLARATEIVEMVRDASKSYGRAEAWEATQRGEAVKSGVVPFSKEEYESKVSLLSQKASRLLSRTAAQMHGNDTTFDMLKTELLPVAEAMEALKAKVDGGQAGLADANAFKTLKTQLDAARAAIDLAAREGIRYEGEVTCFIPEASVMNAVRTHLDKLGQDLEALQQRACAQTAEKLAEETFPGASDLAALVDPETNLMDSLFPGSKNASVLARTKSAIADLTKIAAETKADFKDCLAGKKLPADVNRAVLHRYGKVSGSLGHLASVCKLLNAAVAYLENPKCLSPVSRATLFGQQIVAMADTIKADERLKDEITRLSEQGVFARMAKFDNPDTDKNTVKKELAVVCAHVGKMGVRNADGVAADDKLLLGLMRGDFSADSYISAKTLNAPAEMVNPALDDAALVDAKRLGNGQMNTVFLCTYRTSDGGEQKFVFKPEISGRAGMDRMGLNGNNSYADDQQIAHLNFASKKISMLLGDGHVMPNTYVGVHDGMIGFFMEVAPGIPGEKIANEFRAKCAQKDPGSVFSDLKALCTGKKKPADPEGAKTFVCTMAREFAELEWGDLLSGQGDRHWGNYHVSVDKKHNVSVMGIDNDISFPKWRFGALKFRAEGRHAENFEAYIYSTRKIKLREAVAGLNPGQAVPNLPGVTYRGHGVYDIDLTPKPGVEMTKDEKAFACGVALKVFGMQKTSQPSFVSETTYRKLQELNAKTDLELKETLKTQLQIELSDEQLDACVARTRDAYRRAEELRIAGRMKKDDEWISDETYRQVADDLDVAGKQSADEQRFLQGAMMGDILAPAGFRRLPVL